MVRRFERFSSTLAGLGLAAVLAAGCGGTTSTATPIGTASHAPSVSTQPGGTVDGSAGHSSSAASPNATQTYPLAHVDAALEDKLPSMVGGVTLTKWSMPVSSYIASVTGGDSVLYAPWLVKFGKTPDEVDMALAQDFSGHENANLRAIQVAGSNPTQLSAGLSDVATKAGWPTKTVTSLPKTPVLQIKDPTVDPTKTPNTAFVFVEGDIVFFVISDDLSVVIQALAALP
jgi:hypothetical protein